MLIPSEKSCESTAIAMKCDHRRQVQIEDRVAVGAHERPRAQKIRERVHRASRAEQDRLWRPYDVEAELRPVAERRLHRARHRAEGIDQRERGHGLVVGEVVGRAAGRLDPSGVPDYNATVEVVGARCLAADTETKEVAAD